MNVIFRPVTHRIDSSRRLSQRIDRISSLMATQRGLLLLIGTATVALSLIAHAVVIVLLVTQADLSNALYWLCLPAALFHVGVLAGFTGIMLATPLGQGYKDK
ncbi:MAG: hypothetical protein GX613_02705 [Chloroflexi bacterium]|nr:hypothetical protein [Chloroflexota bacterium]